MKFSKGMFFLSMLTALPAFAGVTLKGTGSYLAAPLILKWMEAFHRERPDLSLRFEVKNSSDGISQWLGKGAEFAATDTALSGAEEKKANGRAILHLPAAIEAVVITYNLPGVPSGLQLSPKALSGLFMGTIKKWNDAAIVDANPGVKLPPMDVLVIHREEESALHDLFPDYLSRLDPKWTLKREKDKNLHWPLGQNIKGNPKIVEKMRKWPGVIAAVDYSFAVQNHLPMAKLHNQAGQYVGPSAESLTAAASDFLSLPEGFQVVLERSRTPEAYPLCTFAWLLVYQDTYKTYHDHKRGAALVDFLNWAYSDGQKLEADLGFVPLSEVFLSQVREKIKTIQY